MGLAACHPVSNDGKGFVFISHLGEVFPSGFLPASAGNVRKSRLRPKVMEHRDLCHS
jgi:MoaA/NifB/PqqE/SkfB family radical SAM enzyme